ncbi:MAG: signal peptidase I [Methylococcales bacterium]
MIWGGYAIYSKLTCRDAAETSRHAEPLLVEYARSFFPIVFIVLILRSFLVEPFRIPSGSMMPTLLVGDFILVNKFAYGVRLPVLNNKILAVGKPERGDIAVFRFPRNPEVDYIKRVLGLPGDRISYYGKQVYLNGEAVKLTSLGPYQGVGQGKDMTGSIRMAEELPGGEHTILVMPGPSGREGDFEVPQAHYFMMGDNRDNSNDSRYWGTVPEENLVGKAFMIWMNWDWENSGIALNRLGTLLK